MRWKDLSDLQREQLIMLMMILREFKYGYDQSILMAAISEEGAAAQRFYSNSLYQYFANLFLLESKHGIRDILREIECLDLVETIDSILSYPVGSKDLRFILREFRNKQLVHTSYTFDQLERFLESKRRLGNDMNFRDPKVIDAVVIRAGDLFSRTVDLYRNLLGRFPELLSPSDLSGNGSNDQTS